MAPRKTTVCANDFISPRLITRHYPKSVNSQSAKGIGINFSFIDVSVDNISAVSNKRLVILLILEGTV